MKNILFALLLLSIISCKKKYCWDCETVRVTYISNEIAATDTTTQIHCDRTEEEAKDLFKSENKSYMNGPFLTRIQTDTRCSKQ